jgi:CheY-like chemotaxis protein
MPDVTDASPATAVRVLLVSDRNWFASALRAVLEPEGFVFVRMRVARTALRDVAHVDPDLMIIDDGLPDVEAASLTSAMDDGALKPSIPILVYSASSWQERELPTGLRAAAWDVIREPLRPHVIVAKLRRLLEIRRLIEATEEGAPSDLPTGLFSLAGMMRMLRVMVAAARREGTELSCVAIGPTEIRMPEPDPEARARFAALCGTNVRESDICGWVRGSDLGIVAFGADAAGATSLVRRLSERAVADAEMAFQSPLSAGIAQISAGGPAQSEADSPRVTSVASRVASLSRVAAAQGALDQARQAGGGIRIAEAG